MTERRRNLPVMPKKPFGEIDCKSRNLGMRKKILFETNLISDYIDQIIKEERDN